MNDQDKRKFKELMAGVGELYGKDITKPLLSLYFNALEELSIEQVSQAFTNHVKSTGKEGTFFPKPADLMRQIKGSEEDRKASTDDRAMIAWSCIEQAMSRIGSYQALELEDKQALATVKAMGGWQKLCETTYDQLPFRRREFIKMYETFERTPIEKLPASLPGFHELEQHKKEASHALSHLVSEINKIGNDGHE